MHARSGVWANLLSFLGLTVGLLLLFGATVVVAGLIVSWMKGTPLTDPQNVYLGIICGLVAVLFISIFHFKQEMVLLPFHDRHALTERVQKGLETLGYQLVSQSEEELLFRPSFQSWLLGGFIRVQLKGDSARLLGPKVYLEMLRQNIRLQSHITDMRSKIVDSRQLEDDQLLKRLEICNLRVAKEQWQALHDHVLEVLAGEGAEVICNVSILAQQEKGIRRLKTELPIRQWLNEQNIIAEIHREKIPAPAPK